MDLTLLEKKLTFKKGSTITQKPLALQNFLKTHGVNFSLLLPKQQPGVYGIFFQSINKIYIGQAKSVSFEISMYLTGQRPNILINKLVKANPKDAFSFAFFQGEGLAESSIRRQIEDILIKKTSTDNINVISTQKQALIEPSELAQSNFLQTNIIEGSLAKYGLPYVGFIPPKTEACIYLYINPDTNKFYIGETSNFYTGFVMKRHRNSIYNFVKRQNTDTKISSDIVLEKICNDFTKTNNTLLFTAVENLDSASKKERLEAETRYKNEASQQYKDRLYNSMNYTPSIGTLRQSEVSKEKIRTAALYQDITQDLTQYPCICEGKWFNNKSEASRAYGYSTRDGIKTKLESLSYPDFIWLKDTKGKKIPTDPAIQAKVTSFYQNLKPRPINIIKRNNNSLD
jgi:hypothetical protein